jgi:uncharacterized protein
MVYLDTSILAAYYCPEPLSKQAERRIRSSSEPAISELTEVELSSAVARKVRERDLDRQDALKILAQFHAHLESGRYLSSQSFGRSLSDGEELAEPDGMAITHA